MLLVVLSALVIAGVVYGISSKLHAVYQASASFRVVVPNQQGVSDPVVVASNDLATQYAQLASSRPVQEAAARSLGVPAQGLKDQLTGSTLNAVNIVQVTASAPRPLTAVARAQAAADALRNIVDALNEAQKATYSQSVQRGLEPVNATISGLEARLRRDRTLSARQTDNALLASLLNERQQVLQTLAQNTAAGQPTLQPVSASGARKVSPRPALYALVALVLALLIGMRLVFLRAGPAVGRDAP